MLMNRSAKTVLPLGVIIWTFLAIFFIKVSVTNSLNISAKLFRRSNVIFWKFRDHFNRKIPEMS